MFKLEMMKTDCSNLSDLLIDPSIGLNLKK
jgi:hypothetical protein